MILSTTAVKEYRTNGDAGALDRCLARVAEQDREALAELYRRTSPSVYGFALSILKNTQDAEDVLHDCYVNLHSAAAGYRSSGKPMAWILTVTRTCAWPGSGSGSARPDLPPGGLGTLSGRPGEDDAGGPAGAHPVHEAADRSGAADCDAPRRGRLQAPEIASCWSCRCPRCSQNTAGP